LLTGRPGTGKSQLADRVAWEFDLAPVLRFEAQSVSEAQDLFYRFDTVGRLGAAHGGGAVDPRNYIKLAALGKAVLYSHPFNEKTFDGLTVSPAHPAPATGRASVVLIDEIDKASRDFPNDLLNAIERMAFRVGELDGREFAAARETQLRPIVVITSNSERELPEPFLRRCVYYNIPDPLPQTLRQIVSARVLKRRAKPATEAAAGVAAKPATEAAPAGALPTLFSELVDCFVDYRDLGGKRLAFVPGTSELIDLARVIAADAEAKPEEPLANEVNLASAQRAAGAVAKGKGDAEEFAKHVTTWRRPVPAEK
jgi:MoxR-like ATPase